jgi:hypothetical protein
MENKTTISKWVVLIQDDSGSQGRLKTLSELFPEYVKFSDERQRYYLTDREIPSSKTIDEAFEHFEALFLNMTLACSEVLTTKGLSLNAIHTVFADGSWGGGHHYVKVDGCTMRLTCHPPRIIVGDPEEAMQNLRREQLQRLQLVKTNPCVAYVLRALKQTDRQLDGLTLRMAYDAIVANSPGKVKQAYRTDYKVVKKNLDYYHCHPGEFMGEQEPKTKLTLGECERQVKELSEKWIAYLMSIEQL